MKFIRISTYEAQGEWEEVKELKTKEIFWTPCMLKNNSNDL